MGRHSLSHALSHVKLRKRSQCFCCENHIRHGISVLISVSWFFNLLHSWMQEPLSHSWLIDIPELHYVILCCGFSFSSISLTSCPHNIHTYTQIQILTIYKRRIEVYERLNVFFPTPTPFMNQDIKMVNISPPDRLLKIHHQRNQFLSCRFFCF